MEVKVITYCILTRANSLIDETWSQILNFCLYMGQQQQKSLKSFSEYVIVQCSSIILVERLNKYYFFKAVNKFKIEEADIKIIIF